MALQLFFMPAASREHPFLFSARAEEPSGTGRKEKGAAGREQQQGVSDKACGIFLPGACEERDSQQEEEVPESG